MMKYLLKTRGHTLNPSNYSFSFNTLWNTLLYRKYCFPSAGVGRTGMFIALDILVEQANAEKQVHPLKTVETLRNQRLNMVQTKVCLPVMIIQK